MSSIKISGVISALESGKLVVYPTDTLYGLGADIYNEEAVKKIYILKKRSFDQPLSVAVSNVKDIEDIAYVDDRVRRIAEEFLPGKITLILKKREVVSDLVTGGSDKIGVRIPNNLFTLKLLSVFGPLTCTSANVHGNQTPSGIDDIQMQLKDDKIIYIDAGKLKSKPSTIIDLSEEKPVIIREGAIPSKEILKAIE